MQKSENTTIYFAQEAWGNLSRWLELHKTSATFLLADAHTLRHCAPRLWKQVPHLAKAPRYVLPPGENSKSLAQLESLWNWLGQHGADRHAVLINLGGGVVTDLGGMAAATYMRGITSVNVPTSLLAMADASVGGKTGINLGGFKNRVGVFSQPAMTLIDTDFLHSLPANEFRAGWAEMLKHGLIADENHFDELAAMEARAQNLSTEQLKRSIAIKEKIVAEDPYERGSRHQLNFGHSVAHAMESLAAQNGEELLHGIAVGQGMQVELDISVACAQMPVEQARRVGPILRKLYPTPGRPYDADALLERIAGDKKNREGALHFSLLNALGKAAQKTIPVAPETLRQLLVQSGMAQ